jgi:hypothetical protein
MKVKKYYQIDEVDYGFEVGEVCIDIYYELPHKISKMWPGFVANNGEQIFYIPIYKTTSGLLFDEYDLKKL